VVLACHGPGAEPLAGARGRSPRKILSIYGALEAILAIRNIKIYIKLKVVNVTIISKICPINE
jgi:hypothetical protein